MGAAVANNCSGNVGFLESARNSFVALGNKAQSKDFEMLIDGMEGFKTLIQATQIPEIGRESVEMFAPYGVPFYQQGTAKVAGELAITFMETVSGTVMQTIRQKAKDRCYFNATIKLACEEKPGSVGPLTYKFYDCWIKLDPTDLSTDDTTGLVRPAGTMFYNWFDVV